jgi:hypothetical protein
VNEATNFRSALEAYRDALSALLAAIAGSDTLKAVSQQPPRLVWYTHGYADEVHRLEQDVDRARQTWWEMLGADDRVRSESRLDSAHG